MTGREEIAAAEKAASRGWLLVSASVAIVLVLALGAIIAFRPSEPFAVDLAWMAEVVEHRSPAWTVPALFFDTIGGGVIGSVVIPVVVFALLLAFRRPWGATCFAAASLLSVLAVQILKHTVGRARPSEILVTSDAGSFPSGHTANAVTMAVVFGILFARVWVWCAGIAWALLMAVSRTYLGAHWLSDTVGGLLLGAGVAVIVWVLLALRLRRERSASHPWAGRPRP